MPRDHWLYVEDMLAAASKCQKYAGELTKEQFLSDEMAEDAVLHNLMVLGEAAKQVPEDIRGQAPQVDWRGMAGLRDVVAHQYFGIDWDAIWDVVRNELPALELALTGLLDDKRPSREGGS